MQGPANVCVVRLMCSGAVDPVFVLQSPLEGADGVLIGGCHAGDCHYQDGNHKAQRRVDPPEEILKGVGMDQFRLWLRCGSLLARWRHLRGAKNEVCRDRV